MQGICSKYKSKIKKNSEFFIRSFGNEMEDINYCFFLS